MPTSVTEEEYHALKLAEQAERLLLPDAPPRKRARRPIVKEEASTSSTLVSPPPNPQSQQTHIPESAFGGTLPENLCQHFLQCSTQSPVLESPLKPQVLESQQILTITSCSDGIASDGPGELTLERLEELSDSEEDESTVVLENIDYTTEEPAHLPEDMNDDCAQFLQRQDADADRLLTGLLTRDKTEHMTFEWTNDKDSFLGRRENFVGPSGPTFALEITDRPLDVFLRYFDDEVFNLIVSGMNRICDHLKTRTFTKHSRFNRLKETNKSEIAIFLAVLVLQSIHPLEVEKDYFKENGYLTLKYFKSLMPYNRFVLLKRLLLLTDNNDESTIDNNKLRKLGPLLNLLQSKFKGLYLPSRDITIDESLLKWHGRLNFGQKIASKASKVGIKTYELCESSTGYCWDFFIYTGNGHTHNGHDRGNTDRLETDGRDTERQDNDRQETNGRDTERQDNDRQETNGRGTKRQDNDRQETNGRDTERQDNDRQETNGRDTKRQDNDRQETNGRDTERQDNDIQETNGRDTKRQDNDRQETNGRDTKRQDNDRQETNGRGTERQDNDRQGDEPAFDPGEVLYLYESPAGYGIVVLRVAAWVVFAYSTFCTVKKYPQKNMFYCPFFICGTLWFFAGPLFILTANNFIDKWVRESVVTAVLLFITFSGHIMFLLLTLPVFANKNFPYHVRTTQIGVMEVTNNSTIDGFGHNAYLPTNGTAQTVIIPLTRRTEELIGNMYNQYMATAPPISLENDTPKLNGIRKLDSISPKNKLINQDSTETNHSDDIKPSLQKENEIFTVESQFAKMDNVPIAKVLPVEKNYPKNGQVDGESYPKNGEVNESILSDLPVLRSRRNILEPIKRDEVPVPLWSLAKGPCVVGMLKKTKNVTEEDEPGLQNGSLPNGKKVPPVRNGLKQSSGEISTILEGRVQSYVNESTVNLFTATGLKNQSQ